MGIFIDTGKVEEVKKYMDMGIIRGATCNPTILLKDGVTGGQKGIKMRTIEMAGILRPYPLSVEVTTNDPKEMISEAKEYAQWADNINVKITIHGPQGETENLAVIHELAVKDHIQINATAMMSAQQCLLAAMAGATYVSIFGGRVNNMGYNACDEIRKLRNVLDLQKLPAQIIVGSTREVLNVIEWLDAGADIVTVMPDILKQMIVHPYSKETVQMFLRDAAKTKELL
ncbi:MAG: transaldolase family protein [bacterium]